MIAHNKCITGSQRKLKLKTA